MFQATIPCTGKKHAPVACRVRLGGAFYRLMLIVIDITLSLSNTWLKRIVVDTVFIFITCYNTATTRNTLHIDAR